MELGTGELRAFLEVSRLGSISKAAKAIGVTQPSLSWTIRRLEERLDATLFVRTKTGVTLTRVGKLLESRSRELVRQVEDLQQVIRDETVLVQGCYSIGVYPTLAAYALPSFLPGLLKAWPHLQIELAHDSSRKIAEGVIQFQYDLGIVANPPRHPDLTIVPLYKDTVRLWRAKTTTWRLPHKHVPIVCNPKMSQVPIILDQLEAEERLNQHRVIRTTDLGVALSLTLAGSGIGILPETLTWGAKMPLLALRNSPQVQDQIALIWRKDSQRSNASHEIRQAIRQSLTAQKGVLPPPP